MIDSHSHIYTERYQDDRDTVIARAVGRRGHPTSPGRVYLKSPRSVVALSARVAGIYAAVGVHPHQATTVGLDVLDALEALVHHPKVSPGAKSGWTAITSQSPRCATAGVCVPNSNVPSSVTCPWSFTPAKPSEPPWASCRDYPVPRSGQVHCFTGTPAMAEQLLAMGFYIGFTGIVSFPKADNVRAAVRVVPLERLLIETDSPYLAPLPYRGRRNVTAFVRHMAEAIAHVKGVPWKMSCTIPPEFLPPVWKSRYDMGAAQRRGHRSPCR